MRLRAHALLSNRARARRGRLRALVCGALVVVGCWLAALPVGAAEQVAVTLGVPSVTVMNVDGCMPSTQDVTDFGQVIPDIAVRTDDDCELLFGSTGSAATLKLYQEARTGAAMAGRGAISELWDDLYIGVNEHLRAVAALPDGRIWVSGYGGTLAFSSDGGANWAPQDSKVSAAHTIRELHVVNANVVWGAAWQNPGAPQVIRTVNGGTDWEDISDPVFGGSNQLRGIRALDAQTAWVGGSSGTVFKTEDGGENWAAAGTPPFTEAIWGMDNVGEQIWTVGGRFSIMYSPDGGDTWVGQNREAGAPNDTDHTFNRIDAYDDQHLIVAGGQGRVMKTSDGGQNWELVNTGVSVILDGLTMFSPTHWIVVGFDGTIIETTDAGESWDAHNTGSTSDLRGFWAPDEVTMFAVGNNGRVRRAPVREVPDYDTAPEADFATEDGGFFGACLREADQGADASASTWTVDAACPMSDGAWWHALPAANGDPGAVVAQTAGPITLGTPARVRLRYGLRAPMGTPVGAIRARLIATVEAP